MVLGVTELRGKEIVSVTRPTCVDHVRDFFRDCEIVMNAEIHRKTNDVISTLANLLETTKPDYVLFALGGNDADIDWKRFIVSQGKIVRTQVSIEKLRANLLKLIEITRQHGAEPIVSLFVSHCLSVRGEYLSRLTGMEVSQWIANGGGDLVAEPELQKFWSMIETLAAEQQVRVAPYGRVLRAEDPAQMLAADGAHPTAQGHWIIAKAMISTLMTSDRTKDVLIAG
jgi:lysophospholipase L1-like esterase